MIETHAPDADAAETYLLEALQGFRRLGLHREAASVLDNLDGAWEAAEAARQLFAEVGDRAGAATLNNLADLARSVDERQLCWDCLLDATSLWNRLGQAGDVQAGLGALQGLAAAWGVAELSFLARAAAEEAPDPATVARALESARWAAIPAPIRSVEVSDDGPLTAREEQVVGLVGRGLTNAEIAAELFISERTVESHVSHARRKLGIDSRTKLTRWALAQGLAGGAAALP